MSVTDEQIAAYSDGELAGDELARVESAVAADPELARKVEAHRALKAKLGAHFAPILNQPVPDRLAAMLQPEPQTAEVVSFGQERAKRGLAPMVRRWAPIAGPALAASLVLAFFQPWNSTDLPTGYANDRLAGVLDTQLAAAQAAGADTRILVSFQNDAGEYCRAYRMSDVGGIACRDSTGWEINREYTLDGAQTTEYRQAGSEAELLAAVQDMAPDGALTAEEEAEAKSNGWR